MNNNQHCSPIWIPLQPPPSSLLMRTTPNYFNTLIFLPFSSFCLLHWINKSQPLRNENSMKMFLLNHSYSQKTRNVIPLNSINPSTSTCMAIVMYNIQLNQRFVHCLFLSLSKSLYWFYRDFPCSYIIMMMSLISTFIILKTMRFHSLFLDIQLSRFSL